MEIGEQLRQATAQLVEAGVPSPRNDAELLASHVLGLSRGEVARHALLGYEIGDDAAQELADLVAERARRVPLQHLTGRAPFRSLELRVGPGVFVPRPETEQVVEEVLEHLRGLGSPSPRVVDLGTGSGAIAAALAAEWPQAEVHAVEVSAEAAAWAELNFAALPQGSAPVTLHRADLREVTELSARPVSGSRGGPARRRDGASAPERAFDVVVSNPPYIPAEMVPRDPEVAEHDPQLALYGGGADGLELPLAVIEAAKRLLVPGGWFIVEHAEVQAAELAGRCVQDPALSAVRTHQDLSGRDRATSAVLRRGQARDVKEWRA